MSYHPSFGFELQPTGDDRSAFHLQNKPQGQVQRPAVLDRHTSMRSSSDLSVQGNLITVVHGKITSDGLSATLIVVRLKLMSSHNSRRFSSAKISFHFRDSEDFLESSVYKIAPFDGYMLDPGWDQHETKLSYGWNFGIHAMGAADGHVKYENTKVFDRLDCGFLCGSAMTEGRSYGSKNTARWSMSQNKSHKSGIPTILNLAILLERSNDEPFFADIKVNAEVDIFYKLGSWIQDVSGKNKIDPIKFDPTLPPMGDIPEGLDMDNLAKCSLDDLGGIETTPALFTTASVPHSNNIHIVSV